MRASATTMVAFTVRAAACRMLCCLAGTCCRADVASPAESLPNMPGIAVSWWSDRGPGRARRIMTATARLAGIGGLAVQVLVEEGPDVGAGDVQGRGPGMPAPVPVPA